MPADNQPIKTTRDIGRTIAELRRKAHITGEELGKRAGLSQSKISKIETGTYARLNAKELDKILNILDASSTIRQQIKRTLEEEVGTIGRGSLPYQVMPGSGYAPLEKAATTLRMYTATALPALLQTVAYRAASLQRKGMEGELEAGAFVKTLMARQDQLWDLKRQFHFIFPQTVLYTQSIPKREYALQLDRLERLLQMPNVRIGIIPFQAGTIMIEYSSFALYDDHALLQALARKDVITRDREEIELHSRVFSELSGLACYDADAIQLIRLAMEYFS